MEKKEVAVKIIKEAIHYENKTEQNELHEKNEQPDGFKKLK